MDCVWYLLLMGNLQDQNRNRLQLSGVGRECRRLTTVDDTASPRRPTEASTWDANDTGHLSEDDCMAGSQPDLMQWVTDTIQAGGCLLIYHSPLITCFLSTHEA